VRGICLHYNLKTQKTTERSVGYYYQKLRNYIFSTREDTKLAKQLNKITKKAWRSFPKDTGTVRGLGGSSA
jgi:hypothetical protein